MTTPEEPAVKAKDIEELRTWAVKILADAAINQPGITTVIHRAARALLAALDAQDVRAPAAGERSREKIEERIHHILQEPHITVLHAARRIADAILPKTAAGLQEGVTALAGDENRGSIGEALDFINRWNIPEQDGMDDDLTVIFMDVRRRGFEEAAQVVELDWRAADGSVLDLGAVAKAVRYMGTLGTLPAPAESVAASGRSEVVLGKFGHHPDETIDAEVEIGRLQGLLHEARAGLLRALDYQAITPNGVSIKNDIRNALERTTPAPASSTAAAPEEEGVK